MRPARRPPETLCETSPGAAAGLRGAALAVLVTALACSSGCAPDLTIGPSTSSSSGSSTSGSTTTSGGTGGTSTGGTSTSSTSTGSGGSQSGDIVWLESLSSEGDEHATSVTVLSGGDVFVAGDETDEMGVPRAAAISMPVSAYPLSGYGPHRANAIAGDSRDRAFVAGMLQGTTALHPADPGYLESSGGTDCLVARVSPQFQWVTKIGTKGYSECNGIVAGATGDLFVAGTFSGTLDETFKTSTGALVVAEGSNDLFLAKLTSEGEAVVAYRYGDKFDQHARAMGSDKAGNLYILGEESGPKGHGETDISLLKLSPEGAILRQEYYGTSSFETAVALAVSPDGSTAIAGTLSTTIHLGGDAIYGAAFVAVFDADGKYVWGRGFQNPTGTVTVGGLLLDDDHGLIVGGGFDETMTLAGDSHAAVGTDDAFVARLDGTGKKLWIKYLGNAQSQAVKGLARKADGTIVAAGQFQGELTAGSQLIGPAQALDVFAMGITP